MAKKNEKARIPLEVLNPERFQSLAEIRAFVSGDEHGALHYAISNALDPPIDDADSRYMQGIIDDARKAAWALNHDLETLARAAVSGGKETRAAPVEPSSFDPAQSQRYRRALLFVALGPTDVYPVERIRQGILAHLGDGVAEGHEPTTAEA